MAAGLRLNFHRIVLAATLAVIAMMAVPPARQVFEQHRRISHEEAKLVALLDENAHLEERLSRLQDPEYVEKLAREQLEMVRPGEISYVLVPPAAEEEPGEAHLGRLPWYERFWNWLEGLF